ncbi:hypothetical protein [Actinokineospora iranica]|uniref:ParB-like nuclease domain-containing protein n=1 Tax=Actinokineospora iranica TaxID=1271860 RepID=A0A1G6K357_9PSEU|nr:hypothetical protein [Actinokineospora iranica]SDC25328.1 hypothetical protein SAMN05216174_101687 [Actinokineospora iranica]
MTGPSTPHPATHIGCHVFTFGTDRWCVTLAQELIAADPTAAEPHPHVGIGDLGVFLGGLVRIDPDHAMTRDLSLPLLIAPLPIGQGSVHVLIDGWHRVYRALSEGLTDLPAYVLTAATEQAARYPLPHYPRGPR